MTPPHKKAAPRTRTAFHTILLPLLALLAAELTLLIAALWFSGVLNQLEQNSRDILSKQVENRKGYLENSMVGTWSGLAPLAASISAQTQALLDDGSLTLEQLETSSDACAPLLLSLSDELISTLYSKNASGIYVIFNTQDLSKCPAAFHRTGFYIRDLDPSSTPSARKADLLLELAPIPVVKAMDISTDTNWATRFLFDLRSAATTYDPLWKPFQAAYEADSVGSVTDFGYWGLATFPNQTEALTALSYSVPLVLPSGTVFGVLGVDLLADYLQTLLPGRELFDDNQGIYFLATSDGGRDGSLQIFPQLANCPQADLGPSTGLTLTGTEFGGYTYLQDGVRYDCAVEPLSLYSSNGPFESQHWVLVGAVPTRALDAFSHLVRFLLGAAILLMLLAGVAGSVFIGRRFSRPIRLLSQEVDRAQRSKEGIPCLSATGIREIDRFSSAFTALSRDVVGASTRFLRIMEMASVELGGFELQDGDQSVFVTDNFFHLMGLEPTPPSALTAGGFRALLRHLDHALEHSRSADGSVLYQVPQPQGGCRYIRVETTETAGRQIGLVEDVTAATLERLRIEHDRDYDLLTGLLNRRAFYRITEELFRTPEKLGFAALVMLDLDNLKSANDRFGHDWGDQYIHRAGQQFAASVPQGTLCSRVSGDEFFLFFYGYSSHQTIRTALENFSRAMRESRFPLPDGETTSILASGGVAWYPDDTRDFGELMKYADFAMYQVKQTQKGRLGDFDLRSYHQESYLAQTRQEFQQLLNQQSVSYHFQPIVDARTGAVEAYEALMRVNLPTLRSPTAVLQLARESGQLQAVEDLTWLTAPGCYRKLLDQGLVRPEALLFVNSIASECMSEPARTEYRRRYHDLQSRIVVEITESESLTPDAIRAKRALEGNAGMFALDDYGSGYNSEKTLLELSPQFIKVDLGIIRDIDQDADKQRIVSNIVSYAHERNMRIVAEGLETTAELRTLLALGVDLLQGYLLARPAAVPPAIPAPLVKLIREFQPPSSGDSV